MDSLLTAQRSVITFTAMDALKEFLGIRRTVALWEVRADAELGAVHGLGLSDFAALHHLAETPGGRLRRVDLARRLALTPSGVTRLLGPLERRGIVTREEDGNDAGSAAQAQEPDPTGVVDPGPQRTAPLHASGLRSDQLPSR